MIVLTIAVRIILDALGKFAIRLAIAYATIKKANRKD